MRFIPFSFLVFVLASCSSAECKEGASCEPDTGAEEDDTPIGNATVESAWIDGANLEVMVTNIGGTGTFGMAETGRGGAGWYAENCIDGPYCHTIENGTNRFVSVHENATGEAWDGTLDNNQTLMHLDSAENITYAVWDASGACVMSWGHQPDYYAPQGCL